LKERTYAVGEGGGRGREPQADLALSLESDTGLGLPTLRLQPELKPRVQRLTD